MTSITRRRVQSPKVAKVSVGVLGSAVAAISAVTFGNAGIASACTPSASAPFTACAYVMNNTGYTVYSYGGTSTPGATITNGATFQASVVMGDEVIYTFTMPENPNTAASTWTLIYDYESSEFPTKVGFTSGSAPYPASFGWWTKSTLIEKGTGTAMLTLGQDTHSFGTTATSVGLSGTEPSVGQVGHTAETPNYNRGSIIVKNSRPMKIWNARTNPSRGVAAIAPGKVWSTAAVNPDSAPVAAQAQSLTKPVAQRRVASHR